MTTATTNTYATIKSSEEESRPQSEELLVTVVDGPIPPGKDQGRQTVILTLDRDWIQLSEQQVKDLIVILQARMSGKVTAKNPGYVGVFYP